MRDLKEINRQLEPFEIIEYEDGSYGLCLPFIFLEGKYKGYGQDAFNRFAESIGDPVKNEYGLYTHGNGYEWARVFKTAFENDEGLRHIEFGCEAGGFYSYAADLVPLERMGTRFKAICDDPDQFAGLVSQALSKEEPSAMEEECEKSDRNNRAEQTEFPALPDCPLVGADGNVFNLMGIAARTLKENYRPEAAKEMRERVTSCGSYDEALAIMMEYVNPVSADEMDESPDINEQTFM